MKTSLPRKAFVTIQALLITIIFALSTTVRADDNISVSILYYESIQLIDTPLPGDELVTARKSRRLHSMLTAAASN